MSPRRTLMTVCVVGLFAIGSAVWADTPEDAAQSGAEAWLKLVDDGNYAAAWGAGAKLFKSAVNQGEWTKTTSDLRGRFGKVVSRRLKSREYTEKLRGAPDGRYVVIRYETKFEHWSRTVETIIQMADADGTWRVYSYLAH